MYARQSADTHKPNFKAVDDRLDWIIKHVPTIQRRRRFLSEGPSDETGLQDFVPELVDGQPQSLYPSLSRQPNEEKGLLQFDKTPSNLDSEQLATYTSILENSAELLSVLNGEKAEDPTLVFFEGKDEEDNAYLLQAELEKKPEADFDDFLHLLTAVPPQPGVSDVYPKDYPSEEEAEEDRDISTEDEQAIEDLPADSEAHKEQKDQPEVGEANSETRQAA